MTYFHFRVKLIFNQSARGKFLTKQGICYKWYNGVYIARQISRVLVCLNSALNPLVYLHAHEDIRTQLRRLIQQARQAVMQPSVPPTQSVLVQNIGHENETATSYIILLSRCM